MQSKNKTENIYKKVEKIFNNEFKIISNSLNKEKQEYLKNYMPLSIEIENSDKDKLKNIIFRFNSKTFQKYSLKELRASFEASSLSYMLNNSKYDDKFTILDKNISNIINNIAFGLQTAVYSVSLKKVRFEAEVNSFIEKDYNNNNKIIQISFKDVKLLSKFSKLNEKKLKNHILDVFQKEIISNFENVKYWPRINDFFEKANKSLSQVKIEPIPGQFNFYFKVWPYKDKMVYVDFTAEYLPPVENLNKNISNSLKRYAGVIGKSIMITDQTYLANTEGNVENLLFDFNIFMRNSRPIFTACAEFITNKNIIADFMRNIAKNIVPLSIKYLDKSFKLVNTKIRDLEI